MSRPPDPPAPRPGALPARVPLVTRPLSIWQTLRLARQNVLAIIPELAVKQPIVSGKMIRRWHMVMDPPSLRRILRDRVEDYPKSLVTKNILRPAIGESLFIAEGAHWKWQRRTAAPVFSHRNISALGPVMTHAANRATARLAAQGGRPVDIAAEMVTTTFEVIADVTFSSGSAFEPEAVHRAINAYIEETARVTLMDLAGLPDWVPRPGRLFRSRAVARMHQVASAAIAERRHTPNDGVPDLLDLLARGQDPETGRRMTDAELRDNLLTFIVAGHETTALTLSWALYLCAFAPQVQDEAAAQARDVLGPRAATADDLPALPLVRQIINEALRLYPPAAFLARTARAPDELAGREVRPGDTIMLPIYALHRNRLLWEDADAFRPGRFAERGAIDRFAYLPFGDGPRICIGASFALQEAVIVLATLLARFRFSLAGPAPEPALILTLRPRGGIWLSAEPR